MNEVAYQIVYGEKLSNTLQVIPKEPIDPVELMMGGIFCITGGIIIWIMVLVVQIAVDVSGNL